MVQQVNNQLNLFFNHSSPCRSSSVSYSSWQHMDTLHGAHRGGAGIQDLCSAIARTIKDIFRALANCFAHIFSGRSAQSTISTASTEVTNTTQATTSAQSIVSRRRRREQAGSTNSSVPTLRRAPFMENAATLGNRSIIQTNWVSATVDAQTSGQMPLAEIVFGREIRSCFLVQDPRLDQLEAYLNMFESGVELTSEESRQFNAIVSALPAAVRSHFEGEQRQVSVKARSVAAGLHLGPGVQRRPAQVLNLSNRYDISRIALGQVDNNPLLATIDHLFPQNEIMEDNRKRLDEDRRGLPRDPDNYSLERIRGGLVTYMQFVLSSSTGGYMQSIQTLFRMLIAELQSPDIPDDVKRSCFKPLSSVMLEGGCDPRKIEEVSTQLDRLTNARIRDGETLVEKIIAWLATAKESLVYTHFQGGQFHVINHVRERLGSEWGLKMFATQDQYDQHADGCGRVDIDRVRQKFREICTPAFMVEITYDRLRSLQTYELIIRFLQEHNDTLPDGWEDVSSPNAFFELVENPTTRRRDVSKITYFGAAYILKTIGVLTSS